MERIEWSGEFVEMQWPEAVMYAAILLVAIAAIAWIFWPRRLK